MIAVLLAALSAFVWGTGDFCGGKAAQRADSLHVTVVAALTGIPLLGLGLLIHPASALRPVDLAWGAIAGLAGFLGLVLFYKGLASRAMSVVAPVAATISAITPLAIGLVLDGPPRLPALVGVCLAVAAIGLVSLGPEAGRRPAGRLLLLALVSGLLFGLFFAALRQTSPAAGLWPLLAGRLISSSAGALILTRRRTLPSLDRVAWRWALVAGVFDVAANALYLLALHLGSLTVVAPIAAMYPASTVLLALAVDRERLRPVQVAGLGLAAAALVLTAG
jgi:drug/metabolite transporter (DMT)-like permease